MRPRTSVATAVIAAEQAATACRAVPPLHDPARIASDIVLLATVTNAYRSGGEDWDHHLRVDRVLEGKHSE